MKRLVLLLGLALSVSGCAVVDTIDTVHYWLSDEPNVCNEDSKGKYLPKLGECLKLENGLYRWEYQPIGGQ